ncbi:hypothetical protein N8I77_013739 [Diaporthe amygdali]|uniref:Apple domain-containing protein n=1 Tax=Phomopsis amygdali TaxID=1214568 RepID=A0AAD9VXU0_PHOAM|nr:hypothetical protein N8I77_013739 [Diaporthe amygdali]
MSPTPAAVPTCAGFHGYDRDGLNIAYYPATNYSRCLLLCDSNTICLSFGIDTTSACILYNYVIEGNMVAVPSSGNTFYNKGGVCLQTPSGLPISSSTSSTSKPSSIPVNSITFPALIGTATLIAVPAEPESNVNFGFEADSIGSIGYTNLTTGDYIGFYSTSVPAGVQFCDTVGYLYHGRSGLCVTAIVPASPISVKYTGAAVQLQPCDVTGPTPPESQAFCGVQDQTFGGCNMFVQFKGDIITDVPYGSSDADGPESLSFPDGYSWAYGC